MSAIVVLGGAGAVGRWAAEHLAAASETGPADTVLTVDQLGDVSLRGDVRQPGEALLNAVARANIVVLALPEDVALDCLAWLPEAAPRSAMLLPTCSVQAPFFARAAEAGVLQPLLGVNPMFSPTLPSAGRPVVLVTRESGDPTGPVPDRLTAAGMTVVRMTATEHDATMSYVQALPHAAVLGFAMALAGAPVDAARLMAVAPPPARTLIALASRILTGKPEVYWDIQHANAVAAARRTELVDSVAHLDKSAASGDAAGFQSTLDSIAHWLGPQLSRGAQDCRVIFEELTATGTT